MQTRILALAAGAALLVACGGSKGGSSSGSSGSSGTTSGACTNPAAGQCACTSDTDCPTGYTCDTEQTKTCIFQCQSAADCTANYAPDDVKTTCSSSALGCTCDFDPSTGLSVCSTKGCGTDSDCPGSKVCQSGQCVDNPVTTVSSCQVFPEYQVLNAGQAFTFKVQAYNGSQPVHVTDADVTWSVAGGAPLTNSGATFTVNSSASATEVAGVQASIHGQTCTATVKIYGAPAGYRVTVIDALAGVALSGATVVVDGAAPVQTDSNGVAAGFSGISTGSAHTVSVFKQGFDYVTIVGTGATDVLVPVARDTNVNEGGIKGTVNNLFQANSKIHAGFVGMSIAGSLTDLSTTLLLGTLQPLCDNPAGCSVGGKSLPADIKVPSGVLLGLNDQTFKSHYAALGAAGWCNDASKVAAGTCGTRGIWGLAGDIDIDKISPIIDQVSGGGGVSNINIGSVLTSLLPVLRDFNSLAVRDQAITLGPVDSSGNVQDANLAAKDLDLNATDGSSVRLGLKMTVKVPALPHDPNDATKYVDGAIVLGASDVPGRGIFPLGLTAGVDNTGSVSQPQNVDGHVSWTDAAGTTHTDQVQLNMAPNHNGTESGTYRLAIVASSFSNIANGLVGSGIVVNPGACVSGSSNGVCYGGNITYSQTFMDFPASASFDYASRTLTTGGAPAGAGMMRLDFHDANEHRWFVYFDPSAGTVQVPAPAAGFEDRTRSDDTATGPRSTILLLAFDLGGAGLNDAATFGSSAASLQKLDRFIQRFSIKDYPPPSITITQPTAGSSIAKTGGQVTVKIAGDAGNSNAWVLCANTSTAPITAGDLASCSAGGTADSTGQATAALPANTPTGSAVLHAVLTDASGNALLNPSVEANVTVTVQ